MATVTPLLGLPSDLPTTNYSEIKAAVDIFSGGFENVATNLHNGSESTKLAVQFLERWFKIELAYTKSIEELLESKVANLIPGKSSRFSSREQQAIEPVPELCDAWSCFTGEMAEVNAERKRVAEAVRDTIFAKLSKFSDNLNQRESNLVSEARKVLSSAKSSAADLMMKDDKFKTACKNAAEDVLLVAPAYEPEKKNDILMVLRSSTKAAVKASKILETPVLDPASMTPPQKRRMATMMAELASPSVQKLIDSIKHETQAFHRAVAISKAQSTVTYSEFMPKIIRTLHDVELQRISYMKHCIGHISTGFRGAAKKTTFEKSRRQADRVMSSIVKSCTINAPLPPPPEFEEPDWDEILENTIETLEASVSDDESSNSQRSSFSDNFSIGPTRGHARSISLDTHFNQSKSARDSLLSQPSLSTPGNGNSPNIGRTSSVRGWFSNKVRNSPETRRKRLGDAVVESTWRKARTPEPQRKVFPSIRRSKTPEPTSNRSESTGQLERPKSQLSQEDTGEIDSSSSRPQSREQPQSPSSVPVVQVSTDDVKFPGAPPIFGVMRQLNSPYFNEAQASYRQISPVIKRKKFTRSNSKSSTTSRSSIASVSSPTTPTRDASDMTRTNDSKSNLENISDKKMLVPELRDRSHSYTSVMEKIASDNVGEIKGSNA